MSTILEELVVKILGDVADVNEKFMEAIRITADASSKMENSIREFSDKSQEHLSGFHGAMQTALGVATGEAFIEAINKVAEIAKEVFTEVVVDSIKAAQAQEDAVNRLNVALAGAGKYSKQSSNEMLAYAASLQKTTVYSEENILQASALIETLGKLDKDGLQGATTAAVNLAAALRIDLNTASMMVGKAAEGNILVFKRYGMEIETGASKSETFANTLKAIAQLGDVAAQQANTYTGALAQLSHAQEDSHKALGDLVVQNLAVIDAIKEVTSLLNENTEEGKKNSQAYRELVANGLIIAIEAVNVFVVSLDTMGRVASVVINDIKTLFFGMNAAISGVLSLVSKEQEAVFDKYTKLARESAAAAGQAFEEDTKLGHLSEMLFQVESAAKRGFDAVKSGAIASVEPINQAKDAVAQFTAEQIKQADEGEKIAKKALEGDDPSVKYQRELAALREANSEKRISDKEYAKAKGILENDMILASEDASDREIKELIRKNKELEKIDKDRFAKEISANQKKIKDIAKAAGSQSKANRSMVESDAEHDKQIRDDAAKAGMTALDNLSIFQRSKSKEMQAVGQAAAIASTTINTYDGATAAYKSLAGIPIVGPELGVAAAAAAIAAGMANVAAIEGIGFAGGIDSVPGIGSNDNFPAVLAPKERVVPAKTNEDLTWLIQTMKQMLGGGGSGGGDTHLVIEFRGDADKYFETQILKRQRMGTSLLPRLA